jgi:hypothetical protein
MYPNTTHSANIWSSSSSSAATTTIRNVQNVSSLERASTVSFSSAATTTIRNVQNVSSLARASTISFTEDPPIKDRVGDLCVSKGYSHVLKFVLETLLAAFTPRRALRTTPGSTRGSRSVRKNVQLNQPCPCLPEDKTPRQKDQIFSIQTKRG